MNKRYKNNKEKRWLKLTIGWLLLTITLNAQTPFYVHYNTNNGLPSSEVYDIHFADDEKVWFTTDRGVAVYNGYEFKTYSSKDGISSNTNFNIFEDAQNRLWFNGIDGSFSLYDEERFYVQTKVDSLKNLLGYHFFAFPVENENGQFLIYSRRPPFNIKKYYLLDPNSNTLSAIPIHELKKRYTIAKSEDVQLLKFGTAILPISEKIGFTEPCIKLDDDWIGYCRNKMYKINSNGQVVAEYVIDGKIEFCYIDSDKDLWFGSNRGLFYLKKADFNKASNLYFPELSITDLAEDFEGNYWMSTGNNGVYFIPNLKLNSLLGIDQNLNNERILSIAALEQNIFFGSYYGDIFSLDKNNQQDTLLLSNEQNTVNLDHAVKYEDTIYFRYHKINETRLNRPVRSRCNLHTYQALIANKINKTGNTHLLESDIPILDTKFQCIAEDRAGVFWIGTYEGLYKVDLGKQIRYAKKKISTIPSSARIMSIKKDRHHNLWFASLGHGLAYQTPDTVINITIDKGLSSSLINCLQVQDSTTLWVGTNQGLNKITYSYQENHFQLEDIKSYGVLDGLPSNFINSLEQWNGYLWVATNKGIINIDPDLLTDIHPNIPIFLETFSVNNEIKNLGTSLRLNPNENDIHIRMTGLSYRKNFSPPFYRYRLSGSKGLTNWEYTNDRNIRFIDLIPDQYTFEAAASNRSNEWSESPISITFEIKPFFTQTTSFRSMAIAMSFIIIALIFFLRDRQLKKRNDLQQNLMAAKVKSKEYELNALRNQMNPHFVFNSLNAIQSYIFRKDPIKANYYLSKFSSLMRDSLVFSRHKFIPLKKEIAFLKTYLELEQLRFPEAFDYKFEIDHNIPINQYAIPSLLFQPVLENIVKHAFNEIDYQGKIEFKIREVQPGKIISVTITDNGKGFEGDFFEQEIRAEHHKSLGLGIVKNQIDALNQENGERFAKFSIINLAALDQAIHGVQVKMIIPIKSLISA